MIARFASAAALLLATALPATLAPARPAEALELVMVDEEGCVWCARWNAEIAPAYPKSEEGRAAPLRRVEIDALPEELQIDRPVRFTPTFLLVEDNRELSRMEGYPGADFFWPLLGDMLAKVDATLQDKDAGN